MDILLGFIITLVIIFVVPVLIYGLFSAVLGLKEPDKKLSFLLGVLIQKVGTAIGFVALFYLGKDYFIDNWVAYSAVWFVMFALTELGQTIMSDYSKKEAVAGILSELVYFPLAALMLQSLLN